MHPKQFLELSPDELCRAVESIHGCTAHFEYWHHVKEPYGAVWWMGAVGIFRLLGHPAASRCYAWTWQAWQDSAPRQVFSVLEVAPVATPNDAVRTILDQGVLPAECPP